MAAHTCPHCQTKSTFKDATNGVGWGEWTHALKACTECHGLAWVAWEENFGERLLFPFAPEIPKEIPEFVRSPFAEAVSSLGIGNKISAIMTARAAVQAAMRLQGAKGSNIFEEIEDLVKRADLPDALAKWAHEVRQRAGFIGHPEEDAAEIEQQDVDEIVGFCWTLFDYMYVMPARLAARKSREARPLTSTRDPLAELQRLTAERTAKAEKEAGEKLEKEKEAFERRGNEPRPTNLR